MMIKKRVRLLFFSLSLVLVLICHLAFINTPLVQAQTWEEYYDSLSENPLPDNGVTAPFMFNGEWRAYGYQCLSSASFYDVTAYPEPVNDNVAVVVQNGVLNAIALRGSECIPKGGQAFSAYPPSIIKNKSTFPVTFINGTGKDPTSISIQATLRVIDEDYFVIRVPSFRYLNSNIDEKPLSIEFRRKSRRPFPCNDPRIQNIYDKDHPKYHFYDEPINEICSKTNSNCTKEKVFSTMISQKRFVAPTLDRTPVIHCGEVDLPTVYPYYGNEIITEINEEDYSVINHTLPGHMFYPGQITRKVIDNGSSILVQTIGEGVGDFKNFNEEVAEPTWNTTDTQLRQQF